MGEFMGVSTPARGMDSNGSGYTGYRELADLFEGRVHRSDVLVDVGCGKGRVVGWWLGQGFRNKIVGIELDDELAAGAARRFRRHPNVTIVPGSVVGSVPRDATLFYLFNPFGRDTLVAFRDELERLFVGVGRARVRIIYYNCVHADVFEDSAEWVVRELDMPRSRDALPVAIIQFAEP
jgi:hypothetical protein